MWMLSLLWVMHVSCQVGCQPAGTLIWDWNIGSVLALGLALYLCPQSPSQGENEQCKITEGNALSFMRRDWISLGREGSMREDK